MLEKLSISYLADRPDAIPIIARWLHEEWGNISIWSSTEKISIELRKRGNRLKPPLTIVALIDSQFVGTASLLVREMSIFPDYLYWLSEVYVISNMRQKGIGTLLARKIIDIASEIGFDELFLYTPDQASLYAKLGWVEDTQVQYNGEHVTVMRRAIGPK